MLQNLFKISLIADLLVGFSFTVWGQENLVPNPSFEDHINCPSSLGLETYITDWKSARESPDYFNVCATSSVAGVPSNNFGYQHPYSGNAYIGMLTYRSDSSIYTEAASVQLTNQMIIGQTYYVSFRLSLTIDDFTESNSANNKIGVQFSTVDYSPPNTIPINNYAHLWTDSILTDTVGWTIVKGSFVADSNYSYLSLGNFFDKPYIDTIVYGSNFGAYYYFDDVCVSTDSTFCYQTVGLNETDSELLNFSIYPNPGIDYFLVNQAFTEPYDLIIYNSLGQPLYQEKNISTKSKTINTTSFSKGLLFINIISNNQKFNYKFLKL